MTALWLGASAEEASVVFLLPNKPILPDHYDSRFLKAPDINQLIELNGNHWRKILTIMAKLLSPNDDTWREHRERHLWSRLGVCFSAKQVSGYKGLLFVVGHTFRQSYPVSGMAQIVGDKHVAYVNLPYVWCPYLDYRQFPNVLISALRAQILE
ncbi:DUF6942 family protein [Marinomonas sp. IMCC 4694]|uniref:DUF6942 family protein n=1 Tax=Marinomonas sp. IMCC 4694 TaxID=2605432 RepID=UPI0011E85139|nr:hypothetical protein [Marinomonas sp. IMCC 4694]TYL47792.1 hypothetical protein FXV75_07455 [Marinomonas sp. IMCC 4694]